MNLIGERRTYFYEGEKFVFAYVGNGEWKQVEGGIPPSFVLESLEGDL